MERATTDLITQLTFNAGYRKVVFGITRQIMSVVDGPLDTGQDLNAAVESALATLLASSTPIDWAKLAEHCIEASREPERPAAKVAENGTLTCPHPGCPQGIAEMHEAGYLRTWRIDYPSAQGLVVAAKWGGSEDFSDSGDEDLYFTCAAGHESELPAGWKLDYR